MSGNVPFLPCIRHGSVECLSSPLCYSDPAHRVLASTRTWDWQRKGSMGGYVGSSKWGVNPKIGGFYPPNHPPLNRVFHHYFHHPFWGFLSPYFGFNTQIEILNYWQFGSLDLCDFETPKYDFFVKKIFWNKWLDRIFISQIFCVTFIVG